LVLTSLLRILSPNSSPKKSRCGEGKTAAGTIGMAPFAGREMMPFGNKMSIGGNSGLGRKRLLLFDAIHGGRTQSPQW
jgi:hypothetical protein